MSEIIHGQVLYLLASTCCGMVCMFLYGLVRIFELFLKRLAKVLNHKDVVEHVFLGYRRKGGKGYALLYSHAR